MANFKDYALQYVLTDEEAKMKSVVSKAATEIQESRGNTTVVFKWAESIKPWMPNTGADNLVEDGEEAEGEGDILARAKALGFLSRTLEALDDGVLRPDQVKMLIGFFGSMFRTDHKAGITPSTKALQELMRMKSFKPSQANDVIDHLTKLGDDFRLQAPLTRLEVYELLKSLVENEAICSELQFKHGAACGFMTDLLQMCRNERDPRNLLVWFDILKSFLRNFSPSPEVSEEIFKTFSAYFPISIRASATPTGITAEDLKVSLRVCFSVHYRIAHHVFPFLIKKLDQGDAITVSVKVDILQSLNACLATYSHAEKSIVPSIDRIWNSLKYEVRNGEVEETIEGTLQVMRTLSSRLQGNSLKDFTQLILRDCLDDLTNPTYTLQSGKLLRSVYIASPEAFSTVIQTLLPHIKMNLRQTKSLAHTRDIVILLNSILSARSDLLQDGDNKTKESADLIDSVSPVLTTAFEEIFLPLWNEHATGNDASNNKANILKQIVKGLALLIEQEIVGGDLQRWNLLCTESTCSKASLLLSKLILSSPLSEFSETKQIEIEDEAVLSLQKIATAYAAGFVGMVAEAKPKIREMEDGKALELLTTRLAFIGCSEKPKRVGDFHNLMCLIGAFLEELQTALHTGSHLPTGATLIAAIHCAMLNFRGTLPEEQQGKATPTPLQATWVTEVASSYSNLPQLDTGSTGDWKVAGIASSNWSDYQEEFCKICLFVTRQLYRRATVVSSDGEEPLTLSPDFSQNFELIHYLASMATFVVRELTAETQLSLSLCNEALCLFRGDDTFVGYPVAQLLQARNTARLSTGPHSELLRLSQGILQGLWPSSMTDMCTSGISQSIASQLLELGSTPEIKHQRSANHIICILANKYTRQADSWPVLVHTVASKVDTAISNTDLTNLTLKLRHLQATFAFASGALLNYDKHIPRLVQKLVEVPSHGMMGLYAAREFSTLLSPKQELAPENHAISKRLGRQWAYTQLAKPMLEKAAPFNKAIPEAHNYAVAVMNILKHLPFELYEDDGDSVVRIAIPALTSLGIGPDVEAVLRIMLQFVEYKPEVLKQRLNAVIKGSLELIDSAKGGKKEAHVDDVTGVVTKVNPPSYRKLALVLIACLPLKFEERYLLPHVARLQKVLALACGDPVREVRQAALKARVSWANVN